MMIRILFLSLTLCLMRSGQTLADIVIVVHPENPLKELNTKQVTKIFMGKLKLFPGSSKEILSFDLPTSHALRGQLYKKLANISPSRLARYRASYLFAGRGRLPKTLTSEQEMLRTVAHQKNSIGYMDSAHLNDQVKVVYRLEY